MERLESASLDLAYQFVGYATPNTSLVPFPWTLAVFTQLPPHESARTLEEWADETNLAAQETTVTFLVQRVARFEPDGESCIEEGYSALNPFWTFKELHYLPLAHVANPFQQGLTQGRRARDAPRDWSALNRDWKCQGVLCRAIPWTLSARWSVFSNDTIPAAQQLLWEVRAMEDTPLNLALTYVMHYLLQLETTAHLLGHFVLNPSRFANYEMSSSRLELARIKRMAQKLVLRPEFAAALEILESGRFPAFLRQLLSTTTDAWVQDKVDGMGQLYMWPLKHHFAVLSGSANPAEFWRAYVALADDIDWAIAAQDAVATERGAGHWVDLRDSPFGNFSQRPFGIFAASAFLPRLPPDDNYVANEVAWQSVGRLHTPLTTRIFSHRHDAQFAVSPRWDPQVLVQNFLLVHPFTRYQLAKGNANASHAYKNGTPAIVWLCKILSNLEYIRAPAQLGAGRADLQKRLRVLMEHGMQRRRYKEDSETPSPLRLSLDTSLVDRTEIGRLRRLVDQTMGPWAIWEPLQMTTELDHLYRVMENRVFRLPAHGLIPYCAKTHGESTLWIQYKHQGRREGLPIETALPPARTMEDLKMLIERHFRARQSGPSFGKGSILNSTVAAERPKNVYILFAWERGWSSPAEAVSALSSVVEALRNCERAHAVLITPPFHFGPDLVPMKDVAMRVPHMDLRDTPDLYWSGRMSKDIAKNTALVHAHWWDAWSCSPTSFAPPLLAQIRSVHAAARATHPSFEGHINDASLLTLLRSLLHLPHRIESCTREQMTRAKEAAPSLTEEVYLFPNSVALRSDFLRGEEDARAKIEAKKDILVKVWFSFADIAEAPLRFWNFLHSPKRCWSKCNVNRLVLTLYGPAVDDESAECAKIWLLNTFVNYYCKAP